MPWRPYPVKVDHEVEYMRGSGMRWLALIGAVSILALPGTVAWADPTASLVVRTTAGSVSGTQISGGIVAFKSIP